MNDAWHKAHPMPGHPTLAQRIAWHREHARACGCRPMPRLVAEALEAEARRSDKTRAAEQ